MNHKFAFGQSVIVDGNRDMSMRVTGFCYRTGGVEIELSYFLNGTITTIWVADWRVSDVVS